jgi:hypothetical protein
MATKGCVAVIDSDLSPQERRSGRGRRRVLTGPSEEADGVVRGDELARHLAEAHRGLPGGLSGLDVVAEGRGVGAVAAAGCLGPEGAVHAVAEPADEAALLAANVAHAPGLRVVPAGPPLAPLVAGASVVRLAPRGDAEALAHTLPGSPATLAAVPLGRDAAPAAALGVLARAGFAACTYDPGRHAFVPYQPSATDGHGLAFCARPAGFERSCCVAPGRRALQAP